MHGSMGRKTRTIEIGTTSFDTEGLATAIRIVSHAKTETINGSPMPPTALVTETAAVRMPSAIVKLVPKRAYELLNKEGLSPEGRALPRSTRANERTREA